MSRNLWLLLPQSHKKDFTSTQVILFQIIFYFVSYVSVSNDSQQYSFRLSHNACEVSYRRFTKQADGGKGGPNQEQTGFSFLLDKNRPCAYFSQNKPQHHSMGGVSNSNLFSNRTNVNFNCIEKLSWTTGYQTMSDSSLLVSQDPKLAVKDQGYFSYKLKISTRITLITFKVLSCCRQLQGFPHGNLIPNLDTILSFVIILVTR